MYKIKDTIIIIFICIQVRQSVSFNGWYSFVFRGFDFRLKFSVVNSLYFNLMLFCKRILFFSWKKMVDR